MGSSYNLKGRGGCVGLIGMKKRLTVGGCQGKAGGGQPGRDSVTKV